MTRTTRILLATGIALMVAVPTGGSHAAPSPPVAVTTPTATTTTTVTTVTVRAGDSLSGIAHRHGVRLSALLQANSMTLTSVILPGDTLQIPARTTPASPTTTAPAAAPAAPAAAGSTTYVVNAGDALSTIARRHGVRLGALLQANNLQATSVIMPGRTLTIPPATMPVPATATPARTGTAAQTATVTPSASAPATPTAAAGGSLATVLAFLRAQVGVPYSFFRAGPDAFDCSGLVVAAFRQVGIALPHQSRALAQRGTAVDWAAAPIAAGDLVFTSAVGDPNLITHVGIALDATTWIHAVGVGRTVSISALPPASKIMAVRRIALP